MEIRAVDDVMFHEADDETLAARAAEDFEAFAELYRRYECVVPRDRGRCRLRRQMESTEEDVRK
jgi:hypothetical protein